MQTESAAVELQPDRASPEAERIIRQGQAERLAVLQREQREQDAKERAHRVKENALFCALVDVASEMIPEPLAQYIDFDRGQFSYPAYDGHTVYLDVPGCTRIAAGFGTVQTDERPWRLGTAGYLVAVPSLWCSDDDGWVVSKPQLWPSRAGKNADGWEAFPSLPLALAFAREQFHRVAELEADAAARNLEREQQTAARERAKADRKAAKGPGEVLLDALREYIFSMPIQCPPEE